MLAFCELAQYVSTLISMLPIDRYPMSPELNWEEFVERQERFVADNLSRAAAQRRRAPSPVHMSPGSRRILQVRQEPLPAGASLASCVCHLTLCCLTGSVLCTHISCSVVSNHSDLACSRFDRETILVYENNAAIRAVGIHPHTTSNYSYKNFSLPSHSLFIKSACMIKLPGSPA